jgi:hypothetical protein
MKSHYLLLFTLLLNIACSRIEKKETVKDFILFSYSGFTILDSAKYRFDSSDLDIRAYLEYKPDSIIKISKRKYNHKREFYLQDPSFYKDLPDTLNRILINPYFKKDILMNKDRLRMYDGWYYSLYFKTSKEREILINYIPDTLPKNMMILHKYILKIINSSESSQFGENEFKFDSIVRTQALRMYKLIPPPPPPVRINASKI